MSCILRFVRIVRTLRILGLILLCSPRPLWAHAIVSLTFDDTLAEHEDAARLLEQHGLRGTFFVNSPRLGQHGSLTLEALRGIQAAGHEIGGHTVHHPRLAHIDLGEAERQICDDRVALVQAGFAVQSLAYPFGAANPAVQAAAASCGYNSARGVGGGGDTVPPRNPLYLRTVNSLQCTPELDPLLAKIELAAQSPNTTWFILVAHHLLPACEPYAMAWADFARLLDWLEESAGERLQVATLQQILGGSTQPAHRGHPAPLRSTHGNVLLNGALEDYEEDAAWGPPRCWQQAGWGDNDAVWRRDPVAARGAFAQTVYVDRWVDGARRLVSAQDLGACAPQTTPGQSYLLATWYRSSAPAYWMAYYRDAHATWHPWTRSRSLPPTQQFNYRSWRMPPMPAEAEAVSVGLSIASAGSLTVDEVFMQRWEDANDRDQQAADANSWLLFNEPSQLPSAPPS